MSKKILVVDDEENIVELITVNLESAGYIVISAFDGVSGLNKAFSEIPDLIILDIRMPGMDGFSACKNLKDNPKTKEIPVVFLSAATQKKDYENAKEADCDYYFPKPFDPVELVKIVDSILKG
ncbi:MAG: response regulator [Elusimicrobiota bacterium]